MQFGILNEEFNEISIWITVYQKDQIKSNQSHQELYKKASSRHGRQSNERDSKSYARKKKSTKQSFVQYGGIPNALEY